MMELQLVPRTETHVTPALLTLTNMLALPTAELHQLVQQELSSNPALEELELEDDHDLSDETVLELLTQRLQATNLDTGSVTASGDDDFDPLLLVAAPQSATERLRADLRASLPASEHAIAELLIESLDERGLLPDRPADLAATLHVSLERVQRVLEQAQTLGPPGIATADVRECLLMQLSMLAQEGRIPVPTHTATIVADYLHELGNHRDRSIARQMGITVEQVAAARSFVQQHCHPHPIDLSSDSTITGEQRVRYNRPDVHIRHTADDRFTVEVLHSPRRLLQINPLYRELVRQKESLNEDEREHVQEYLARARTFLTTLRQRESTLQLVTEAIVAHQEQFLRHGVRHLRALTRAHIAAEVGVHESTVSRTTADKVALLPDQQLLPFREFFAAARPVQDVLRELVEQETTPLSDSELARLLHERGYSVARRTVAKYRDLLHILPSTLRNR